jgi:hypothetical protein
MARIVDGGIVLGIGDEAVIDVLIEVAARNAARKRAQAEKELAEARERDDVRTAAPGG